MKKILCLILAGVICMGLGGCMRNIAEGGIKMIWGAATIVSEKEQKAMLKHLEEKYGEKFVIKEIHLPDDESSLDRGATVYPEGLEDESFYVNLGTRGSKKCADDYVLQGPEKRMQPLYEEWIQNIIPSAKVAVELSIMYKSKEVMYNPDDTLQQFIYQTDEISIDVNIMLSKDMLSSKDEIFEALSKLPETEPILGYWSSRYTIVFFVPEAFNSIKSGEIRYDSIYLPSEDDPDKDIVIAITYFYAKDPDNNIRKPSEALKVMNDNFEIKEETP